jgi:Pyruvate/2-oxoacid:ferredoxin oxidoreductase delta subunit
MKEGTTAADSIERFLRGLDMHEGRKRDYEAYSLPIRTAYKPEPEVVWIPPEKRMHFQIFEKGFTLQEAKEEAKRCLTCGPCLSCKACVSIGFEKSLYAVEVDEARCSGCSICVYVCNYDAAQLKHVEEKLISTTDMFKCKSCGMCVVACPSQARSLVADDTERRIEAAIANL